MPGMIPTFSRAQGLPIFSGHWKRFRKRNMRIFAKFMRSMSLNRPEKSKIKPRKSGFMTRKKKNWRANASESGFLLNIPTAT